MNFQTFCEFVVNHIFRRPRFHNKFTKSLKIHNEFTTYSQKVQRTSNMLRTFTKRYGPLFEQPGQRLGHSGPSWSQTGDAGNIVAQNHGFQDNTTSGKEKTKPREKTRTKTRQNKNTREQTHRMYLDRDTTEQRQHKR